MSGPYCETCGHFYQGPMSGDGGECEDPAKIIYSKGGQSSEKPWVYKKCECCNWIDADDPVAHKIRDLMRLADWLEDPKQSPRIVTPSGYPPALLREIAKELKLKSTDISNGD